MGRSRRRVLILGLGASLLITAVVAYALVALLRKAPAPTMTAAPLPTAFAGRLSVGWPAVGESALAVQGVGLIGSHGGNRPEAIASVAKIMTAFIVLRDHPLRPGEDGPSLVITPADVALYKSDIALDESTVQVKAGEVLSERQALEALLLPSANNIATLLAEWDAGSLDAFVAKMNATAKALGMSRTHYADASGFDPTTVSTARNQVRLALAAIRVPAFANLVATRQVALPVGGLQENLDSLLGTNGIIGIKTGTTDSAGGCFVLAARVHVGHRIVMVAGAVMGQPASATEPTILVAALHAAGVLAKSVPHVMRGFNALARGRTFAWIRSPWAREVPVKPAKLPSLVGWSGLPVRITIVPRPDLKAPIRRGEQVGEAVVTVGHQHAQLALLAVRPVPLPSLGWRVLHP